MDNPKKVRISIFTRLVVFFCAVVLVLTGVSYSIYNKGIDIINGEVGAYNAILLDTLSDNLTNEFKRIITLQYELTDNWDLTKLGMEIGELDNYERSQSVLRIRDKLNAIKTSSQLIDEIRIILPDIEMVISTGTVHLLTEDDLSFVENYASMTQKQVIMDQHRILMVAEYPQLYYERDLKPKFIIAASISEKLLEKYIAAQNVAKGGGGFLYSPETGTVLGGGPDMNVIDALISKVDLTEMTDYVVNKAEAGHAAYHVYGTELDIGDILLIRYVREDIIYADIEDYKNILWLFMLAAFIGIILFARSLYGMIHTPLNKLVHAFEQVADTDEAVLIHHHRKDEFNYIYESFNAMSARLHKLVEQVLKQTILAQKSELKHLQSQINPHFFYNSFLTLSNRIEMEDIEFASRFSAQLAKFFMYVTRNKKDVVALKEEVNHAVTYADIQHARFRNRLQLEFQPLPEAFENIKVPRIVLQPIMENAFEHALESNSEEGILYMWFEDCDPYIDIIIADNGETLDTDKLEAMRESLKDAEVETTGMINIHRRLAIRYGQDAGISLARSDYGGLEVRLRIPKDGEEHV